MQATEKREGAPLQDSRYAVWLEPRRIFLVLGIIFGTAMALIVPPFQVPDEPVHFLRSYQISEGQFVPTWRDNEGGGSLPASISLLCQRFDAVHANRTTTTGRDIMDALTQIPLQPGVRTDYIFNNEHYSPLAFVPQALATAIGRILDWPPLRIFYFVRMVNLYIWIALGYAALGIAPMFGRPLLILMLMPMSVFMAASVSPDAATNGLAFVLIALIVRAITAADDKFVGLRWLAAFILCSAALCIFKVAYFPLSGLILLIPAKKLGGRRSLAITLILLTFACLAPTVIWSRFTPGLDLVTYPGNPFVSPRRQLNFLVHHPTAFALLPIYSAQRDGWLIILSFVGRLGWMNIQLSLIFVFAYLIALILSCRPDETWLGFPKFWRLAVVTLLAIAASVEGTLVVVDMSWTSVSALRVDGLQGRYFIAIAPVVLLLMLGIWRLLPGKFWSHGTIARRNAIAAGIVFAGCAYALVVVYFHYYVAIGFDSV